MTGVSGEPWRRISGNHLVKQTNKQKHKIKSQKEKERANETQRLCLLLKKSVEAKAQLWVTRYSSSSILAILNARVAT